MQRAPVVVKLLTRPGCTLCDQAKFIIRRIRDTERSISMEAKSVNILKETQYLHYNDELPVILVDETPVCRTEVKESVLR